MRSSNISAESKRELVRLLVFFSNIFRHTLPYENLGNFLSSHNLSKVIVCSVKSSTELPLPIAELLEKKRKGQYLLVSFMN